MFEKKKRYSHHQKGLEQLSETTVSQILFDFNKKRPDMQCIEDVKKNLLYQRLDNWYILTAN